MLNVIIVRIVAFLFLFKKIFSIQIFYCDCVVLFCANFWFHRLLTSFKSAELPLSLLDAVVVGVFEGDMLVADGVRSSSAPKSSIVTSLLTGSLLVLVLAAGSVSMLETWEIGFSLLGESVIEEESEVVGGGGWGTMTGAIVAY